MLYALCAALSLALLGLDQWVKHYVTVNIPLGEAQPFLPGLVELRTVHNYGAAWSSFSGMRWLLVAVTSVIVIAVAVVLLRRIVRHPLGVAAGFLILSGGVGNIIDRVRLGDLNPRFLRHESAQALTGFARRLFQRDQGGR